ncbi:MAG: WG repeat-containing protein [Flavobacteriia bacterium]|nr:WG repeat-containing protein [Flavobacteriia bacterium]
MKAACILIVTFLTFSSFAQPFKADTFGRVIDPAFIPFIKSREYQLVENFTSDNYNNLKLAYVWKNEKLVCIDLMGREFSSKDDAEDFYRNSEKNSFFNDNDRNESNAIYTYVGEEEPKKDPLKSRFTDIYTGGTNSRRISATLRICAEKVERLCSRDCASPISANTPVDETNQLLLPFEYDKLSSLDIAFTSIETNLPKHLFIFQEPGKKVGVMNRDKKVMVEPVYDGMAVTYNGLLAFQGELTGLISVNGEIIVPFQKMKVNNVGHGKISGSINDKRCTLDFYGNVVFGNRPSGF